MIFVEMDKIPRSARFDINWISSMIVHCLSCNREIRTKKVCDLYACRHCGSDNVRIVKGWRIPETTLKRAIDAGQLTMCRNNPSETDFNNFKAWRDFPDKVKPEARHQIKCKGATHVISHEVGASGTGPASPQ